MQHISLLNIVLSSIMVVYGVESSPTDKFMRSVAQFPFPWFPYPDGNAIRQHALDMIAATQKRIAEQNAREEANCKLVDSKTTEMSDGTTITHSTYKCGDGTKTKTTMTSSSDGGASSTSTGGGASSSSSSSSSGPTNSQTSTFKQGPSSDSVNDGGKKASQPSAVASSDNSNNNGQTVNEVSSSDSSNDGGSKASQPSAVASSDTSNDGGQGQTVNEVSSSDSSNNGGASSVASTSGNGASAMSYASG